MECSTTPSTPQWTSWAPWSSCNVTCGQGVKTRFRECPQGKGKCPGSNVDTTTCKKSPCPCEVKVTDATPDLYIEKDGKPGLTSDDEIVEDGDTVGNGVVLYSKCNKCTCKNGELKCTKKKCKGDCQWLNWSTWSTCSKTCDGGSKTRSRKFKPGDFNGEPCRGPANDTAQCNTQDCPSEWTPWNSWGDCSVTCGGGKKRRTRVCLNALGDKMNNCPGKPKEVTSCNSLTCPGGCKDNEKWSKCANNKCPVSCEDLGSDVSCVKQEACKPGCVCKNGYLRNSKDKCIKKKKCPCINKDGKEFPPGPIKSDDKCKKCKCKSGKITCRDKECDQDCKWKKWTAWSKCSAPCDGHSKRTRKIKQVKKGNGKRCVGPASEKKSCGPDCITHCIIDGNKYDIGDVVPSDNSDCEKCICNPKGLKECKDRKNSNVDGSWSEWSVWSKCSETCDGGHRVRQKSCDNPARKCKGAPCAGNSTQTEKCNEQNCPPVCGWSEWSNWSKCSKTCGEATKRRKRKCGCEVKKDCKGKKKQTSECELDVCPEPCTVGPWSEWSKCSTTCGEGFKKRQRKIITEAINGGKCPKLKGKKSCGKKCEQGCKDPEQYVPCANEVCHQICEDISTLVKCEKVKKCIPGCACPNGTLLQDGKCVKENQCRCEWDPTLFPGVPQPPSKKLVPGYTIKKKCNTCTCEKGGWKCTEKKCDKDCKWSKWTPVGNCSATCGEGKQLVTRNISSPAEYDGKKCTGPKKKYIKCHVDCKCENGTVYDKTKKCERTCDDLTSLTKVKSNCEPGCKCAPNYYRKGDKCVKVDKCLECRVGDKVYPPGQTWTPEGEDCKMCVCKNGACDKKDTCNPKIVCGKGEKKIIKAGTKCCYKCVPDEIPNKVCQAIVKTVPLIQILPQFAKCEEAQKLMVEEHMCGGTCGPSAETAPVTFAGKKGVAPKKKCKCCSGIEGDAVEYKFNCNNKEIKISVATFDKCVCNTCTGSKKKVPIS